MDQLIKYVELDTPPVFETEAMAVFVKRHERNEKSFPRCHVLFARLLGFGETDLLHRGGNHVTSSFAYYPSSLAVIPVALRINQCFPNDPCQQ